MTNINSMGANGFTKILLSENDNRFPSFLQGFNRRWNAMYCKALYLCYTANGTALALDDAILNYGKQVKIKSGGHCYESFVYGEETLAILDITPMMGYGYDPEKGYFLESGGTNWSAFQALFRDYSKVLPAGSCYSVGLGGHICGGGYGLLSRLNGLTVDWLTGVEVVVKDKKDQPSYCVYISDHSTSEDERNLFWAHKGGGGGNFGVITKYYFKDLPQAPEGAFITSVAYPWKEMNADLLGQLLAFLARFAGRTDNWRQFGIAALNHSAAGDINLVFQTTVCGGEAMDDIRNQFIQPLLDELNGIHPFRHMSKPGISQLSQLYHHTTDTEYYTLYEAVQTLNGSGPNRRGKYKSAYMKKPFPDAQIQSIYHWLTNIPNGLTTADMQQSLLQVDSYGGKINDVAPDATPIPQRSSILKLQYQTYWTECAKDSSHLRWIKEFYEEVYQDTGGIPDPVQDKTDTVDGCYYNYPDVDLNGPSGNQERALQLYFGENLKRLRATKHRWDSNNFFNHKQSIK